MKAVVDILKTYSRINLDYQDIHRFSQALLFFSKNFSAIGKPDIFLSSQDQDGAKLSKILPDISHHVFFSEDFEDYTLFLRTSGSSGIPKLIAKDFSQMCNEARFLVNFIQHDLGLPSIKHILCSVQQYHLYGLSFAVFMPLFLPTKPQVLKIEPFIENIMAFSQDVLITSPTLLHKITQIEEVSENFKNLKLIISAGSPLEDKVRKQLKTHATILDIYGSTETGVIGYNVGDGLERFATVNLSCNSKKELIVSSPWCKKIQTSDMAEIIEDKILLLGRSDDIIKINDKRFSLHEVQLKVKQNPLIADCFAYSRNNRIALALQLSLEGIEHFRVHGKQGIIQSIRDDLELKNVASYLRFFKIITHISRDSQGKISKEQRQSLIQLKEKIILEKVEKSDHHAIFEGVINEGCFCFDGHFVDFPLVPGFVELGLAIEYAKILGICFTDIVKIMNVKFTMFLRPKDHCRLHLEKKNKSLYFKMFANQKACLSGRALIEEKG